MTDSDWRDAIEARLRAATPGPWVAHDLSDAVFDSKNHKGWWWVWRKEALPYYGGILEPDRTGPETDDGPDVAIGVCNITDNRDGERERLDAEFIAHAPEDIAALVAAVRERDAALARVEALAADFEGGQYNIICRLIRAALADPKETE